MPFLYSTHGKLRSRIQPKSFLPRRKRVTTQQLQILNAVFKQNPFPSIEERFNLSERLGISARSIQIWFQNKRQTVRSFAHE
ncbi:homeobox-domain-containing protein [Conidiobolus coronatus NRRL 28638]|uniref:Homeobox-domain-containing protein n=1 Tax=Conidiobolus coronatus (strain ATCC 28846 / CBS 209.66 / NRRL 28638) TaxID=796925 RepID=A0A137NTL3_CONC2|nr:homeobox-domain-containing protein [Conidiobolus coronatus NRRL 28638]|eukprot:KXN66082.1 homeobox-domain-containing protein [Conidiobolus coronatus NRRL 28638]